MRHKTFCLALLLSTVPLATLAIAAEEDGTLKEGDVAPVFTGKVLNPDVAGSKTVALDQVVGGQAAAPKKAVILSFFAQYCEPCKKELPYLEALHQKYKDQGLGVMVVSIDQKEEDIQKAKDLVKEKGVTYPVLSDRFNIVAKRYGVKRLPCLYIVDATGKVSMVNTGYTEEFSGTLLSAVQTRLGVPLDPKAVPHAAPAPAESVVTSATTPEPADAVADDKGASKKKSKKKGK